MSAPRDLDTKKRINRRQAIIELVGNRHRDELFTQAVFGEKGFRPASHQETDELLTVCGEHIAITVSMVDITFVQHPDFIAVVGRQAVLGQRLVTH